MMWWTAIVFGLLGSLHCIGMCGPIALAVPVGNGTKFSRYFKFFIYNSGRIISYSILGLIFGLAGTGLQIAGFQQSISIVSGILIISSVILLYYLPRRKRFGFITSMIQKPFARFFQKKNFPAVLMIGILNGFLPCGLVYLALAGALAQTDAVNGMIYMALFGAGTIPAFFILKISSELITSNLKLKLRKYIPVVTIFIGILFIIRGLGLGIPYLSPEIVKIKNENGQTIEVASCCSKPSQFKSSSKTHTDCKKGVKCH